MPPADQDNPNVADTAEQDDGLGLANWDDACPYLPDRICTTEGFLVRELPPDVYQMLMDRGFRRSGQIIYRPRCKGCRQCVPIRVKVADFHPSKSQRRCWRANQDLHVEVTQPHLSQEKWQLYERYIRQRHGGQHDTTMAALERFLYNSPTRSLEMSYRDPAGRLLAVGLCDQGDAFLSTVYCYFDPSEKHRGLGTFSALWELQFALDRNIGYYYLGYAVSDCPAMRYKATFRPYELLGEDGVWRSGDLRRQGEL